MPSLACDAWEDAAHNSVLAFTAQPVTKDVCLLGVVTLLPGILLAALGGQPPGQCGAEVQWPTSLHSGCRKILHRVRFGFRQYFWALHVSKNETLVSVSLWVLTRRSSSYLRGHLHPRVIHSMEFAPCRGCSAVIPPHPLPSLGTGLSSISVATKQRKHACWFPLPPLVAVAVSVRVPCVRFVNRSAGNQVSGQ